MNKLVMAAIVLLYGYNLGLAQDEGENSTTLIRNGKSSEDIKLLNSKYDLDKIGMDEVFVIRNGEYQQEMGTSSISSSSSSMSGAVTNMSPQSAQLNTTPSAPAPKPETVSSTTTSAKPQNTTSSHKKSKSKKKRVKMKRVKLKKHKAKKYKGKSCFKF